MSAWLNPRDFESAGNASPRTGAGTKPKIEVDELDLPRLREQACAALSAVNDPPYLFRCGERLVRVVQDGDGGVRAEELTRDRLRHELANAAAWYRERRAVAPPMELVQDLLADPRPPLPKLNRLVEVPVFLPGGRLLVQGYDSPTGVLCWPPKALCGLNVPGEPSPEATQAARELILNRILGDFPFVGEADRAHALALSLLPLVRELIVGPTPLHLISKPAPGTGGTLLAEVLLYPALGRWPAAQAAPPDEGEWRRVLFAALWGHPDYVFLDNIAVLSSATLALAITGDGLRDRVVGSSSVGTVPVRCIWVAVGNRPIISEELRRRAVWIHLDAGPQPELRRDFKIPDLRAAVIERRCEIVRALLTLVQAWLRAGQPRGNLQFASFESWAAVMNGILAVAGVEGFLANRDQRTEHVCEPVPTEFLVRWYSEYGTEPVGVAKLVALADGLLAAGLKGRARAIGLGKLLASLAGQQFGSYRIEPAGTYKRAARYRLIRDKSEPDHGRDTAVKM
jgi:putative DNA primase/helicase